MLRVFSYFWHVTLRNASIFFKVKEGLAFKEDRLRIIGLLRVRNESLLLQDTLEHLSRFVDGIIIFDDASTDDSVAIALQHPKVIKVIINKRWRRNRAWEETANRKKIHDHAKAYKPMWFFYCDADERFEGDIKNFLLKECPLDVAGIRISLFDAYITPSDQRPYKQGESLFGFRKLFGIERRDILMMWRNTPEVAFKVPDAREPQGVRGKIITKFFCQHYGKSLSIDHWEETCKYYATFFPKYSEKWKARMGKAVHEESDFGTPLMKWKTVKLSSKRI